MNKPCVLLVDAEELVRTPLAEYLRECGYRVLEAINAKEAQRLLSEGSQTIDIVLADIQTLGAGRVRFRSLGAAKQTRGQGCFGGNHRCCGAHRRRVMRGRAADTKAI